jgi:hypothetical protein
MPANPLIRTRLDGSGKPRRDDEIDHNLVATQASGKLVFVDLGGYHYNLAASNYEGEPSFKVSTIFLRSDWSIPGT